MVYIKMSIAADKILPKYGDNVEVGDVYLKLKSATGTPSFLSHYEYIEDYAVEFSGCIADKAHSIKIARVGEVVTLTLEGFASAQTGSDYLAIKEPLPTRLRPSGRIRFPAVVSDNSVTSLGILEVADDGSLLFAKNIDYDAFSGSGVAQFRGISVTYVITTDDVKKK
jgi:hypothetical protein